MFTALHLLNLLCDLQITAQMSSMKVNVHCICLTKVGSIKLMKGKGQGHCSRLIVRSITIEGLVAFEITWHNVMYHEMMCRVHF